MEATMQPIDFACAPGSIQVLAHLEEDTLFLVGINNDSQYSEAFRIKIWKEYCSSGAGGISVKCEKPDNLAFENLWPPDELRLAFDAGKEIIIDHPEVSPLFALTQQAEVALEGWFARHEDNLVLYNPEQTDQIVSVPLNSYIKELVFLLLLST